MRDDGFAKAIIEGAYKAYAAGNPAPVDKVCILIDAMHRDIHNLPSAVTDEVMGRLPTNGNGNGRRRFRDRAKPALPAVSGLGIGALIVQVIQALS